MTPRFGLTADAGALIALERGDRRVVGLFDRAVGGGGEIHVPAGVLAQVLRLPARQAVLMRFLRHPQTRTLPLDRIDAAAVGMLLGRCGGTDVVDAHVVICARRADHPVVTSDAGDLLRLAPDLRLVEV